MAWPTNVYVYRDNNDPDGILRVAKNLDEVPIPSDGLPMKFGKYSFTTNGKIKVVLSEEADV